jgi:transcriptional regulator with XRE-family HTH domain
MVSQLDRFAKNLRKARLALGWTQEELAAASDLHFTAISLLERAEREPRLSTVTRLASALNMELCDLLAGIDGTAPLR